MTKIKICGITNLKDALAAAEAGADLLGFNFYLKSPRHIEPGACQEITSVLRKDFPRITLVGVYVNASVSEIRATLETCNLHLAQLHGDETPAMLAELGDHAFKAIRLTAQTSVSPFCHRPSAPASVSPLHSIAPVAHPTLLVDAAVNGLYGGSGMVADWSATKKLAERVPLLLAGGLTPDNVGAAVRQVRPWGVDVASGVESSPRAKDSGKMKAFVEAVCSVTE